MILNLDDRMSHIQFVQNKKQSSIRNLSRNMFLLKIFYPKERAFALVTDQFDFYEHPPSYVC